MILLIIPTYLNIAVSVIGFLALCGLVLILYGLVIRPAVAIHADREAPPPAEGSSQEIIFDGAMRTLRFSIGQIDSDFKTRMNEIKEDHLVLKFMKDRDLEDYEIQLSSGGYVLLRLPHSKAMEKMQGAEKITSAELIGDTAGFRLAANVRDGRASQYVEFELAAKYFINKVGEERMKFVVTLKKIFPSLDKNSRSKKGIYMFGRLKSQQAEE
ncbi:MAG: hypothetical protein K8S54_19660 [Spirochaetia bacterium]|nr:hypothetical protein [Spirochaetia bacterium]